MWSKTGLDNTHAKRFIKTNLIPVDDISTCADSTEVEEIPKGFSIDFLATGKQYFRDPEHWEGLTVHELEINLRAIFLVNFYTLTKLNIVHTDKKGKFFTY